MEKLNIFKHFVNELMRERIKVLLVVCPDKDGATHFFQVLSKDHPRILWWSDHSRISPSKTRWSDINTAYSLTLIKGDYLDYIVLTTVNAKGAIINLKNLNTPHVVIMNPSAIDYEL